MSDPSQKPPVAGVGAAAGARGGGSGGALLRYGGGVGARGGRVYSAGRSWTTTPSSLPPSTNPLHAYAVPNPHYHSYRGGDGGRGPWTPRGGGRQLSTYHQNNQLYYPPSPSPMARPHRNKSLIITYPAPAMALPVAPALPLTTGNLLNADTKMLPAEEKETRAAATAASATSKDICDDDVQVDREILEMMATYRNALGSMGRGAFTSHPLFFQSSNGNNLSPSSFSTRKRSLEEAARGGHEEKKRRRVSTSLYCIGSLFQALFTPKAYHGLHAFTIDKPFPAPPQTATQTATHLLDIPSNAKHIKSKS